MLLPLRCDEGRGRHRFHHVGHVVASSITSIMSAYQRFPSATTFVVRLWAMISRAPRCPERTSIPRNVARHLTSNPNPPRNALHSCRANAVSTPCQRRANAVLTPRSQARRTSPLAHRLAPLPVPFQHLRLPRQPLLRKAEQDEPRVERRARRRLGQGQGGDVSGAPGRRRGVHVIVHTCLRGGLA
jgi:hypothetical protein